MSKALLCLWLVFASSANAGPISRAVAAFPELPAPPQGEVHWIAKSMRMNGLPMTIQLVAARDAPIELIRFYESWARREGTLRSRRWRTHDTEVLSMRAASYLITMELRKVVNGTQGTIVTSSPPEKAELNTITEFAHPSWWRIANLQQYEDDGKQTEHITFTSARAPVSEAQAMSDMFTSNGWTLIDKSSLSINAVLLEAQRNAESARVVITNDEDHRANTLVTVLWSRG